MNAFKRDSSFMTAKQAELHSMRIRSQEGRYPPSSFADQHKAVNNPESELNRHAAAKRITEFSLGGSKESFQRVKTNDAAHEISAVMQAAAKSQREASNNISVPTRPSINGPRHNSVQAPKVIAGPQIMGKGNNKIDIAQVQDYLNNLKM